MSKSAGQISSSLPLQQFYMQLKEQLERPLEGFHAHARMAPSSHPGRKNRNFAANGKPSGVLILLFPGSTGEISTVFIRRTIYGGTHSGQISFPGGKAEPTDPDLQHTALRETFEEIGVPWNDIDIIGQLSPLYIPPSQFLVTPFIGTLFFTPTFIPDSKEVAEILPITLDDLMQPQAVSQMNISLAEVGTIQVPCYAIQGIEIWGATAMILSEFIQVIQKTLEPNDSLV